MGIVSKLLREDNKQISEMIKQLDQKILDLRKTNKLPLEYQEPILEFYQQAVIPWTERYYLLNTEVDPQVEEEVVDKIYELFLLLQALED